MTVTVTVANEAHSTDDLDVNLLQGVTLSSPNNPLTKTHLVQPGKTVKLTLELEDEISIMRRPRIMAG